MLLQTNFKLQYYLGQITKTTGTYPKTTGTNPKTTGTFVPVVTVLKYALRIGIGVATWRQEFKSR